MKQHAYPAFLTLLLQMPQYSLASLLDFWAGAVTGVRLGSCPKLPQASVYRTLEIHIWTDKESVSSGSSALELSFAQPVKEISYQNGSCDFQSGRKLSCRPGPGGHTWLQITTGQWLSSEATTDHTPSGTEWFVQLTKGDAVEDLDIYFNGQKIGDPLEPDDRLMFLKRSTAYAILQEILQREHLKEAIESEAQKRQKNLADTIESAAEDIVRPNRSKYKKRIESLNKKEEKSPMHDNMELSRAPHCSTQKNIPNASGYQWVDFTSYHACKPRIDIILPVKESLTNHQDESMDSDNDQGKAQNSKIKSTPSARGRQALAQRGGATDRSIGRGGGRGRGSHSDKSGTAPSSPGQEQQQAPKQLDQQTIIAKQAKTNPESPFLEKALSLKNQLTLWYQRFISEKKFRDATELDKTYEDIRKLGLDMGGKLIENVLYEALTSDYWRLKALLVNQTKQDQDKSYYIGYAKLHADFLKKLTTESEEWRLYQQNVIRWAEQTPSS